MPTTMNPERSWRAGLAALGLVLLAACGGGGGGGESPAAPVTVGAPTPASVNATVVQGLRLDPLTLTGALTGPVESLDGRPVYVTVEDPAGLYEPTAFLTVDRAGSGWRWTLTLTGRTLTTTGRRTGSLRLRACLDPGCASPLAGTPLTVAYSVDVVAPLVLSTTRIERSAAFGTQPANVPVTVTIPAVSSAWAVRNTTPYAADRPQRVIVNPRGPFSATGGWIQDIENAIDYNTGTGFEVRFAPAPPGEYRETLSVIVETRSAGGGVDYLSRNIEVVYTVSETPGLRHQFLPAVLDVTRSASAPTASPVVDSVLVTSTGVTAIPIGVEYLEQPPGATRGPLTSWLSMSPWVLVQPCIGSGAPVVYECLAPGLYRAQLRYRLDFAGGGEFVTLPVNLTITP